MQDSTLTTPALYRGPLPPISGRENNSDSQDGSPGVISWAGTLDSASLLGDPDGKQGSDPVFLDGKFSFLLT